MKFCSKCGKEIMDEAVVCPNCGCPVANINPNAQNSTSDQVNIGLCILSVFIPLFGIIWWITKYKEKPKEAKACGITGLIVWVIALLLCFV